jgi:hypothetical protein
MKPSCSKDNGAAPGMFPKRAAEAGCAAQNEPRPQGARQIIVSHAPEACDIGVVLFDLKI